VRAARDGQGDDEEELSSKPLALLLQNSVSLTSDEATSTSKGKSRLREELLDIERLKDVGGSQPVSPQQTHSSPVLTALGWIH
jgi:U3 small nucleolar RNA-associated protein 18